jgi:tRNA U34 2-thiouridine synthase MnmA/TrmU
MKYSRKSGKLKLLTRKYFILQDHELKCYEEEPKEKDFVLGKDNSLWTMKLTAQTSVLIITKTSERILSIKTKTRSLKIKIEVENNSDDELNWIRQIRKAVNQVKNGK